MNEIEKILKDNMEDYESVKRQALKFIHENKKELSKNYAYAEVCGNPVDASHFFFLIDEKKPGSDLLLEMLDYSLKNYVSSEKASVTACIKGGFHLVKNLYCILCISVVRLYRYYDKDKVVGHRRKGRSSLPGCRIPYVGRRVLS